MSIPKITVSSPKVLKFMKNSQFNNAMADILGHTDKDALNLSRMSKNIAKVDSDAFVKSGREFFSTVLGLFD